MRNFRNSVQFVKFGFFVNWKGGQSRSDWDNQLR
jgi:hypothetical protein